jgi:hypothetical protein
MKKLFVALIAFVVGMGLLSCVSPFYGTARIEPGWNVEVGVAATSFLTNIFEYSYIGGRADLELRYGFSRYLQVNGRLGAGAGYRPPSNVPGNPPVSGGIQPLVDGALGVQAAYPLNEVTPAVRLEVGKFLSVIPLLGLGKKELLTLGVRLGFGFEGGFLPLGTFLTIHPCSRFSIFAGAQLGSLFNYMPAMGIPPFTAGIAYKFF